DEQVFMVDELPRVIEYLEENLDMVNLGLLLIFKTGLRVGELAGLKNVDVKNGVIHVNRTEISHKGSDGAMVYEVRDFPKTDAGIREVILPDNYEWILRKIRVLNPFGEYLFEKDGERIRTYVFRNRLYTVCKKAEAKRKSPHKARKTYGSILIDSGVPESTVINQMGHTDIKTTKQHYYKNRRSVVQIKDEINKVEGL
ncbi:MAG: site-specific integrase, partial [Lachnospiraceae bacterium]|nr:site-specific integrase [Lachnospiraceae bacterium]